MQLRGLIAGAVLLVLLAGGVWYSNKLEKEKEGKPAADAPPKIVEIPSDQIQQVAMEKAGGTTTIKRGADSKWEITAPKPMRADQDSAGAVANTFNSLSADRVVEEKASDLSAYGLANPSLTVAVTKKDGKSTRLLLGEDTPTGSGVFARLDGDPRVFTIASFNKSSMDKSTKDLMDKRLLTFDSDKLTRIEMTVKGKSFEFGKNNQNEWQILRPVPMRADGGLVEELVRKLKDAKMDSFASEEELGKFAKAFQSASLVAVAKVSDAAGTQQLEIKRSTDLTYYVKSSVIEGVHKGTTDLGDGAAKSLDDYRNKKLFDFGWSDPSKVEVRAGPVQRTLAKTSGKWMEANKEMDATSVQALIDKLRDLSATSFPEKGFGPVEMEAQVTSNEGKRVEKVLISKSGDKYFAKRDNEPALYEITKTAADDISSAAKDVKPPAPKKDEKKKK